MGALLVAFFVFVMVPALALAAVAASATFGWKALKRFVAMRAETAARPAPATVVAFPSRRAAHAEGASDRIVRAA